MTAFERIDRLYTCAQRCEIWDQPVQHFAARAFVLTATGLLRGLGESQSGDLWRQSALLLRQARRLVCTIPLPFSSPQLQLHDIADQLAGQARQLSGVADPEQTRSLSAAASGLIQLAACGDDPLGECVRDFITLDDPCEGIVILRDRRFVSAVGNSMAHSGVVVRVGTEAELVDREIHISAAVVGPPLWARPGLLNAPRAFNLALVHYDFFREDPEVEPLLYGRTTSTDVIRPVHKTKPFRSGPPQGATPEPPELLSSEECSVSGEIQAAFPSSIVSGNRKSFRDQVQARAALLADGSYVLLPTDADARILALRFDDLPAVHVEQTSASAIGHGDYLALRNRPHHEDLMERADALLGADAESLRTTQSAWKELLWERTKAHPRGIRGISDVIRQRGASTANVGYWISDWCIRPRRKTDFAIVLRFLDFATDLDTTWKRLGRIDSAHRRAGQRYVDDIQRAATPDRMNCLLDIGWCAVTPAGVDSETLLVRVEHILPELLFVPVSALCRLRATEGCK